MRVHEIMTSAPTTVTPEDTLYTAARAMWSHGVGVLPVVDGEGRVTGMITDRDICMSAMIQEERLEKIEVATAMSPIVHAVRADDTVRSAEILMKRHQVRRLPVLNQGGTLLGIVSIDDLAVAAVVRAPEHLPGLSADDIATTLAAVAAPRALETQGRTVLDATRES
ncbi:MAG: CBS domain-containing protein [Myxococcota bacterium]|nr:CBS domain-containing protein [Myxococcota bacterium]